MFEKYFVDNSEKQITVLGGNFLRNFISSGDLSKGFCVVTDRRVYFKGKCYNKDGKHYHKTNEERTVDLKDITGSGFIQTKNVTFLFCSIALVAMSLLFAILVATVSGTYDPVGDFIYAILITMWSAILPLIGYFIFKLKLFEISYAGGKIAFKASSYGTAEMQEFQKDLRTAKDNYYSNNSVQVKMSNVNTSKPSLIGSFEKLKKLKDTGMITDEEFEEKRKGLLKSV